MFKNKRITLKPYKKNIHPSKLSKATTPLTLVKKTTGKKNHHQKRQTMYALIPKEISSEDNPNSLHPSLIPLMTKLMNVFSQRVTSSTAP